MTRPALPCVLRGPAFRAQGFYDAAHEALNKALRSRSRAAPIRQVLLAEAPPIGGGFSTPSHRAEF
jgi:hypothetical protein